MDRLSAIGQQLLPNEVKTASAPKSQDDVVICAAVRTPLTKAKRGALKDTPPEVMVAAVLKGLVDRTKIDPKNIDDIIVGNVCQPGAGAVTSRMAQFLAGYPETTTLSTLNRQCSSGLEAVSAIAAKIKAGYINIGVGAGVESMSLFDMQSSLDPGTLSEQIFEHEIARNCLIPMGQTSENVAEKFGITREKQDRFSVESHKKAGTAQTSGLFKDEIVSVKTTVKSADGKSQEVVVDKDDGVRTDTTFEGLQKLKPAFKKDGTTTAGNSSQVTDGAAAVLLARRSVAQKLGLPILARFISHAVTGVPPEIMGIGPATAIPKALELAKIKKEDVDIFEINEAFASQAVYCVEKLGIDAKKVNPKGGAIAIGHPLGCTGARQIATLLPELKRTNGKFGVTSMCIGTGMGAASVIELE
jgi:acetyl-CoA acyltransferase 1